jgi:hypothetical protein
VRDLEKTKIPFVVNGTYSPQTHPHLASIMMPLTPAPLPQRGEGIRERVLYNREELLTSPPSRGRLRGGWDINGVLASSKSLR